MGHGKIRSYEILETDKVSGTKVVVRVNNFIILLSIAPLPPMENPFFVPTVLEAYALALDGTPVIFCGDLNASPCPSASPSTRNRWNVLRSSLGTTLFFRGDTGETPRALRTESIPLISPEASWTMLLLPTPI